MVWLFADTQTVEEMREAIRATDYHKSSTDNNPQQQNCPLGEENWCKWRKAEHTLVNFRHNNPPLLDKVLEIIKPIYEDLSSNELLERCLETQNNNESLNSLI